MERRDHWHRGSPRIASEKDLNQPGHEATPPSAPPEEGNMAAALLPTAVEGKVANKEGE